MEPLVRRALHAPPTDWIISRLVSSSSRSTRSPLSSSPSPWSTSSGRQRNVGFRQNSHFCPLIITRGSVSIPELFKTTVLVLKLYLRCSGEHIHECPSMLMLVFERGHRCSWIRRGSGRPARQTGQGSDLESSTAECTGPSAWGNATTEPPAPRNHQHGDATFSVCICIGG